MRSTTLCILASLLAGPAVAQEPAVAKKLAQETVWVMTYTNGGG